MHVGEKPYVVTTSEATNEFRGPLAWGQVELSSRVLTSDAVGGMLGQILPLDHRSALDEYGATEYEVTAANNPLERFAIVAARGGDDIWLEIRRHPKPTPKPVPVEAAAPAGPSVAQAAPPIPSPAPVHVTVVAAQQTEPPPVVVAEEPLGEGQPSAPPAAAVIEVLLTPEELPSVQITHTDLRIVESEEPETHELEPIEEVIDLEQPFNFEADEEAELLTSAHDLGDDVMTEGELGELLRASAAAIITGDERAPESPDWLEEEAISSLSAQLFNTRPSEAGPDATEIPQPASEKSAVMGDTTEPPAIEDLEVLISVEASGTLDDAEPGVETALAAAQQPHPALAADGSEQELEHLEPLVLAPPVVEEQAPVLFNVDASRATPQEAGAPVMLAEPLVSAGAADVAEITVAETLAAEAPAPEAPGAEAPAVGRELHVVASSTPEAIEDEPAQIAAVEEEVTAPRPPAIVVPLPRHPKADIAGGTRAASGPSLQRLLRLAAARGAATVYVVAQSVPMVRVDGEFSVLDGEPALSGAFIERLIADVLPVGGDAASSSAEYLIDVPEIGRVRCVTFRDHRGPGVIFRMVPARAISADQLGLSAEVQALSTEADGLILVTGGRGSGKSTLLTSFVDLINRTRSDHIVTTESQIEFVHESKRSFVSQREVRGDGDAFVAAVRAACREDSDVLVIDDMRSPEVVALALEAAESGRLVCASVPGVSITSALERIIEMFPAERREKMQASLAGTLRGVVSQVLLRKLRGGRVAAREVLFNTSPVASLILEGKTFQLPAAIESGRRAGMMSFAESLAALVREGTVHPSHAYRKAPNREQFLAVLRREGVDISLTERLA